MKRNVMDYVELLAFTLCIIGFLMTAPAWLLWASAAFVVYNLPRRTKAEAAAHRAAATEGTRYAYETAPVKGRGKKGRKR